MLEIVSSGELAWRPDWPPDFPPDGFSLVQGRGLSISLSGPSGTFTLSRDAQGRLREFPFFSEGAFVQVRVDYDPSGWLQKMYVQSPGEPWTVDFPEDAFPRNVFPDQLPVRVNRGENWYFVLFLEADSVLSETWYDQEGAFFAYYKAQTRGEGPFRRIRSLEFHGEGGQSREDYDFDSGGNVTGVVSPRGEFTALYNREGRPRYWERNPIPPAELTPEAGFSPIAGTEAPPAPASEPPETSEITEKPGKFALQWDEEGFLTGKSTAPGESGEDYRYEYEKDHRGNWIKRREIEILDLSGLRVPLFRGESERQITYGEE